MVSDGSDSVRPVTRPAEARTVQRITPPTALPSGARRDQRRRHREHVDDNDHQKADGDGVSREAVLGRVAKSLDDSLVGGFRSFQNT